MIQLNSAMQELMHLLEQLADETDIQMQFHLIEYSTIPRWGVGSLENAEEHMNIRFSEASEITNIAEVLKLARSVMRHKYILEPTFKPIILLFTDGVSINL